ncbi:MAG: porphobilinogen synthase, partial [Candidatus Marinimicrobia bacterium]|nr:porphobilinogen synthase [Candidatus Neomarinimicrobiota bacterium]
RPRRNRRSQAIRDMVAETHFDVAQLITPLFIIPGEGLRKEIPSMPGIYQRSIDESAREIARCLELGLTSYLLFGVPTYKDAEGSAAWQDDGIIQLALKRFTKDFPQAHFIADLCFCEYTDHGHCGVIVNDGVDNDQTLLNLGRQALSLAQAGVHTVAPSGMMDGMVAAIRGALDEADFSEVAILSYAVKYASALYGPFREAVDCTPSFGDRRGYQMDPRNRSEAILEAGLDIDEGADMLMVKPAGMYLDIISDLKSNSPLPVVAYQVSGEYSMIKAASEKGWLDGEQLMVESLTALFRAGADAVITYFARELAEYRRR